MNESYTVASLIGAAVLYFLRPLLERWLSRDKKTDDRLDKIADDDAAMKNRIVSAQEKFYEAAIRNSDELREIMRKNTDISESQEKVLAGHRIDLAALAMSNQRGHETSQGLLHEILAALDVYKARNPKMKSVDPLAQALANEAASQGLT